MADVEQVQLHEPEWIDCGDYFKASMDWLREQGPAVVLLASSGFSIDSPLFGLREPDGTMITGAKDKQRVWQASLERSFRAIQEQGGEVLPISTVPRFIVNDDRGGPPAPAG